MNMDSKQFKVGGYANGAGQSSTTQKRRKSTTEVRYVNERYTTSSTSDVEQIAAYQRPSFGNTHVYKLPPPPQQQMHYAVKTVIEFPKKPCKESLGVDNLTNSLQKNNASLYAMLASELKNFRSSNWITIYKMDENQTDGDEAAKAKILKEQPEPPTEVSIASLNMKAEVLNWGFISQPPKPPLLVLMRDIIDNNLNPNVIIKIGEHSFECHLILLRAYSQYFRNVEFHRVIELPEDKITACGFQMLYTWLLAEYPLLQREGIIELFQAATFLDIEELQTQCWQCFDDDSLANEHLAYFLYMEARQYGLSTLSELMLRRITKFFLPLVASLDFLNMNVVDVCSLLSSNCIGVNSEAEVFMSVIYWLDFDWAEREQYMVDLCKCVRFALLPPYYLISFSKITQHNSEQLQRIVQYPEVAKMIADALSVSIWQLYDRNQPEVPEKPYITPRLWIYDKLCKYHDEFLCPNMNAITYQAFLEYLDHLQEMPPSHYHTFEVLPPQRVMDATCNLAKFRFDGSDTSESQP